MLLTQANLSNERQLIDWAPSALHALMLDFFEENARPRGWVAKSSVDPVNFKAALPNVMLLERTHEGDWRFSVVGTGIVSAYGRDFSRGLLSELSYLPCQTVYRTMIDACVASLRPHVCVGQMRYPKREFIDTVKTIIPISDNDEKVTHCLFVLSIERSPEAFVHLYEPTAPTSVRDRLFKVLGRQSSEGDPIWSVDFLHEIQSPDTLKRAN